MKKISFKEYLIPIIIGAIIGTGIAATLLLTNLIFYFMSLAILFLIWLLLRLLYEEERLYSINLFKKEARYGLVSVGSAYLFLISLGLIFTGINLKTGLLPKDILFWAK